MKILLVDDEYYILHGLHQLISSRFPELVIFTADYVTGAREILYREKPDILITDIRIAEENGLDFIKSIKKNFADMHVYVISGYSEFEYAKMAIELNVRYYILKPINQKKLVELLRGSVEEILEERKRRQDEQKTVWLARKRVVSDMIAAGGYTQETAGELERLGLSSLFERYRVADMSIREYWTIAAYQRSIQLSNLKMFIRKKLDELLEMTGWRQYLLIEDKMGNYTLIVSEGEESLRKVLGEIYSVIYEDFKLYSEFRISGEYEGAQNFYTAYCESRGISRKTSRVLFYSGNESRLVKELEEIRYKAVDAMEKENYIQLASLIELVITRFCREYAGNRAAENFSGELYHEIVDYVQDKSKAACPVKKGTEAADSLASEYAVLAQTLRALQQEMNMRKNMDMVEKVISYMDRDIANASLEGAADFVHSTPIYLSIIFKEVEGINFKECLIQKKIDKAKELLEHTKYHIYEIGAMTGYSDIKYFSRMFKRYVGIGPQEYRNQYENKGENE